MNGTAVVCAQLCTYACPIQGGGWEAHVAGLEVGHLPRGGGVLFDEYSVTPTFSVSTRCLMCSMLLRVDLTSVVLFYSCTRSCPPHPMSTTGVLTKQQELLTTAAGKAGGQRQWWWWSERTTPNEAHHWRWRGGGREETRD